jgi:hypothetical protein
MIRVEEVLSDLIVGYLQDAALWEFHGCDSSNDIKICHWPHGMASLIA